MEQIPIEVKEETVRKEKTVRESATGTNKTEGLRNVRQKDHASKFNSTQNMAVKEFKVMFSNVDVFSNDKLNELKAKISEDEEPPQIIAIQEVKPKNFRYERDIIEYTIQGYEIYGENLKQGVGRGLLLYILRRASSMSVLFLRPEYRNILLLKLEVGVMMCCLGPYIGVQIVLLKITIIF